MKRRQYNSLKDWEARSVIRGLVPYRECKFNELTEEDLGSLMIICKRKDQKTETHLLSDDEVDELAVLLGINLYCLFLYGWHIRNRFGWHK